MHANGISINGSQQLVIDSGSGSNVRGFLLTNAEVAESSDDLIASSGATTGDVIMRAPEPQHPLHTSSALCVYF